jgi:AcrR family transcriptional regulator
MARKITDGPIRNKERTKKKVIDALGNILDKDGFSGLNISKVADKAGVDRRLIYDYFGGLEGVVKEYLNAKDYWKINEEDVEGIIVLNKHDFGKAFALDMLEKTFDSLMENAEMRRIITWELSEDLQPLKELNQKREQLGEILLSEIIDDYFKGKDKNFRAIEAILLSSVYYLTLHAQMNMGPFCGIDLKQAEGQAIFKKTIRQIMNWAYD